MTTTSKLPKAFKAKWLKALKSGKYKKGKDRLKDAEGGFCCLGVACAMTGMSHFGDKQVISEFYRKVPKILRGCANDNAIVEWLVFLNDNNNTFEPVINYIEENL